MPEIKPFSAATRPEPDDAPATGIPHLVLCIRVAGMALCIDLEQVERVLSLVLLQPVPQGPDSLAGLMDLHGRTVPVIDLGARLGLADIPAYTTDTPLIICKHESREAGLIVSEVLGIEPIRREQMTEEFDQSRTLFLASVNTRHGLALLLDVEQALEIDWAGHEPAPLLPLTQGAH